jgi:hypothetical protein
MIRAALVLACAGCRSECPVEVPRAELVHWDDPTIILDDGDELEIWSGPQGGWHVFFGLAVATVSPRVEVEISVDALGTRVVESWFDLRLRQYQECEGSLQGIQGFLDIWELQTEEVWSAPDLLGGQDLDVLVTVATDEGVVSDRAVLRGTSEEVNP